MPASYPQKRRYRRLTVERLEQAALFYLSRYAASEASLRRVLTQKIKRAALADEAFAADRAAQDSLVAHIETILEKHRRLGVLNDQAYASMKTSNLRRAGGSARRIAQKLTQKGIAPDVIAKALAQEDSAFEDSAQAELEAARAFARKKCLKAMEKKDIASMARAGFSFDVIRQVLGEDVDCHCEEGPHLSLRGKPPKAG
ncbi:MAG: RecX family transcriptional regulator [Alphaproteobacteria bacterium]|nr:RecX family transcriptional regulator [Alphaproteobacteria bacterium]